MDLSYGQALSSERLSSVLEPGFKMVVVKRSDGYLVIRGGPWNPEKEDEGHKLRCNFAGAEELYGENAIIFPE